MRKIKAVIFDLDGTLVFFKIDFMSARKEIINLLYNLEVPKDLISINERILTTVNIIEKYFSSIGKPPDEIDKIKNQIEEIISKYEMEGAKATELIPGVKELLKKLKKRKYQIGLFTLENREITNFLLKKCAIKSYFDSIVTRDDVQKYKPNPEHLNEVIKQLGVFSHEIIVVGDNPIDLECAKRINAIAIARLNERHKREELLRAGADYTVKSLIEINRLLEEELN